MAHPLLAAFPVVVEQAVVWGDMDSYKHVNNVVYFRYFENVRLEHIRRLDWFQYEADTGIGPILGSTSARFRKALTYPDTIEIGARVIELGSDRFTLEHLIVSRKLDGVVTEGQGVVVAYDYRQQKKASIPDELLRRIEALEATVGRKPASRGR
ncbi:MAG: acyl-CoA thioesterase [Gemmataceae bacterium]|nr:acyl-CoA thioesterase [Gemmataceae bacterium]